MASTSPPRPAEAARATAADTTRRMHRLTEAPADHPAHDSADATAGATADIAALLRVIGRGARGSRSLEREQARWLMQRILAGEVGELQLGAVLLALRFKGESLDEMLGFLDAVDAATPRLRVARPVVVLASVNGARKLANQVPLLGLLLQQRGVATLVIGDEHEDGRLHTAELWPALGLPQARGASEAETALGAGGPVYLDLRDLSPGLAELTARRRLLGVRNAGHSMVKLLCPVAGPGLLLSGYTHGEYGPLMQQVLAARGTAAVVLHGCEGEAVPHPSRRTELGWCHAPAGFDAPPELPAFAGGDLPQLGTALEATRDWTQAVAAGRSAAPAALVAFVDRVAAAAARMA